MRRSKGPTERKTGVNALEVRNESRRAGARDGHLAELFVEVGPAGAYTSKLDADRRVRLIERCRELLPRAPFEVTEWAWTARGLA